MTDMLKHIQNLLKPYNNKYKYITNILLITVSIIICLVIGKHLYQYPNKQFNISLFTSGPQQATNAKDDIPLMKRPFLNIYDNKGNKINVIFITHPFSRDECKEQYDSAIAKGNHFLGISSYCEFPGIISNPHDSLHDPKHKAWTYNYFELCKGWCHCFRNPNQYIPKDYPKILLSESDFAKYNKHIPDPNIKKEYDFLYVCLKDNDTCEPGWQSYNRNWDQAQELLDIMCNKFHLKGLLIGRINCKIPQGCHKLMELTDFMEYDKFIKQYNRCRFVFVPNKLDASPRVMTEAICFNLPVLGNYNITGGWKYVTAETGELFNKEPDDFETVLKRFLKNFNTYKPREFYMREFSEEKMGKQLLDFVMQTVGKDKVNFSIEGPDAVKWLVPGI